MKVLLTGGSGFTGQNILKELGDTYTLFAPSHTELDLTQFQAVETYIKKHHITHVIHTAIKGGNSVLETTLRMFVNILRMSDRLERIIHLGSGAEYGKTRDLVKVKEEGIGIYIPKDPYGLAKYCCNLLSKKEKKVVNLRLFGVYGPYEDYRYKFISNAIVKNLLDIPIKIKQDVVFDYLYIQDFISILKHFLQKKSCIYRDYNITPTKSIKLTQIVKIIHSIAQKKSKISIENTGYNFKYTGDNQRLRKEMPSFCFTSYTEGITRLYTHYSTNIHNLDTAAIMQDDYFVQSKVKK